MLLIFKREWNIRRIDFWGFTSVRSGTFIIAPNSEFPL
jgi:hypothetical protein